MRYKNMRIKTNYYCPNEPHYVPEISYKEYPSLLAAKQAVTKYLNSQK